MMKNDAIPVHDQLATANERSRHLERQLHDKERELKRMINELNEAHRSNRQLQVRIDELREELSLYMPTSPSGTFSNTSLFADMDQSNADDLTNKNDASTDLQGTVDLHKSTLLNDMTPDLTLRCYKSLLNGITNCHQHIFELKQEMWQMYQTIQLTNSILRNYWRSTLTGSDEEDEEIEKEVQTPHPINLSIVTTDLSNLVRKVTCTKERKRNDNDDTETNLHKKLEALTKERDETLSAKNFLEVSLSNARLDLKTVNTQLLRSIEQRLSQQRELEAWQEDMELMVRRSVTSKDGMRRVNSLHHPKKRSNQNQASYRLSLFPFSKQADNVSESSVESDISSLSHPHGTTITHESAADLQQKPTGSFSSWLRRKWNPTTSQSPSASGNDT